MRKPLLLLLLLLLAAGLAGCGPKVVTLKALNEFPVPLVEPLPLSIGVYYTAEFSSFTHNEKRPGPTEDVWTINLGNTQTQVFDAIFSASFERTTQLDSASSTDPSLDAIIVPSVAEFQFALPADTKAQIFEIWIKYDLSIRDREGTEIGHWVFTAYGKTPTAFLKSSEEAIQAATVVALRDAGASMVTGLQRDARIRQWLGLR